MQCNDGTDFRLSFYIVNLDMDYDDKECSRQWLEPAHILAWVLLGKLWVLDCDLLVR